jgi:hypothetical protein
MHFQTNYLSVADICVAQDETRRAEIASYAMYSVHLSTDTVQCASTSAASYCHQHWIWI